MTQQPTGGPTAGDTPGTLARPLTGFDDGANPPISRTDYEKWRDLDPERREARRKQGTPLARIVLGVFLGLLAWSIFCAVVASILLATLLHNIGDSTSGSYFPTPDSTATSSTFGLSDDCRLALDTQYSDTDLRCAGEDPQAVADYVAAQ
jgi:hypothetical protein